MAPALLCALCAFDDLSENGLAVYDAIEIQPVSRQRRPCAGTVARSYHAGYVVHPDNA